MTIPTESFTPEMWAAVKKMLERTPSDIAKELCAVQPMNIDISPLFKEQEIPEGYRLVPAYEGARLLMKLEKIEDSDES
jgi:hypothetical protein